MSHRSNRTNRFSSSRSRFVEPLESRYLLAALTIAQENALPGTPPSQWDIGGAGDPTIQGFATDISVDQGQTVSFKIDDQQQAPYHIDIYRMGYYQGNGARLVTSIPSSQTQDTAQPAPITDSTTGLVDCGNWSVTASWQIPADATSGVYFAKVTREDTGGASHIPFIVRNDASHSDLYFQTSDETWQAYNNYGGKSLYDYLSSNSQRAYAVSYNRPIVTRDYGPEDFFFNAEYPTIRWLESNGYDVSYCTDVDTARYGNLIQNHKVFLSVGHDEYWSGDQRANVTAARDAGVNLAFLSGNEMYWKTRWSGSIDGSNTPFRTLVCYKETLAGAKIDPSTEWTGTWRDPRFSPPANGGQPENAVTGTIFTVNSGTVSLQVPATYAPMRFWRNTSVANLQPGQTMTVAPNVIGYEWDADLDNGFRPAGLIDLSSTTANGVELIQDYGATTTTGTATHSLTLYRAPSGALVFGAGTVQWAWGLDSNHDRDASVPSVTMQQATVNLLADMHVQPATLQSGLVAATASTDNIAPTAVITSPAAGATVSPGTPVTIAGTATDAGGGVVASVEVSTDGGVNWHRATGTSAWTYQWIPNAGGTYTILARAIDDSVNMQNPPASLTQVVQGSSGTSFWNSSVVPSTPSVADSAAVELGVKFRSDVAGVVSGIRFYKGSNNTGTHTGSLWSSNGQLLATASFSGETASGWQQVNFSQPVQILPNITYIASYHTTSGNYADDMGYFAGNTVNSGPLHALADGTDGGNGVYIYGVSAFPNQTWNASNYWVDIVFAASTSSAAPVVVSESPASNATGVATTSPIAVTFNESVLANTISFTLKDSSGNAVAGSTAYNDTTLTATFTPAAPLMAGTTYMATVSGAMDSAGNTMAAPMSWSFTTAPATSTGISLFPPTATPSQISAADAAAVELGVKFRSDVAGLITGIRFYKGPSNTGTHTGSLWSSSGTRLATATFTNETASGWQQVNFSTPVSIQANTTYVASYHTNTGFYSDSVNYFTAGVDSGPLHAPSSSSSGGNGVYHYGASAFPSSTWNASNYWVDVVFAAGADTTAPTITAQSPAPNATGVSTSTAIIATFSESVAGSSIVFTLKNASGTTVAGSIAYNDATKTVTFTPTAALAAGTTYTATVSGATDSSGNTMAAPASWSFTTAAATGTTYSLFPASATPANPNNNDGSPIEVGMKFTTDVPGYITGVRFYKGTGNSGTHTAHLWSGSGQLLASATFTSETASGWQQVNFPTPVLIQPNTTYVVSYWSSAGYYADTVNYFSSTVTNGPLHTPSSASSGGNGVYVYGASAFPRNSWNASNYWVDVLFQPA